MFRHIAITILGLVAIANLNAGQIQIGQTVTGINVGLTTNWVTGTPAVSGCTGCIQGSAGSFSLRNYDTNLFSGAKNGTTSPTPFTGYSNTSGVASTADNVTNGILYDSANAITFDMISQTGSSNNFWAGLNSTNPVIVPVGVFGVTNVWTMLNNYYGPDTVNDTTLIFTFDDNKDGSDAASLTKVTVNLINGVEIRSSVDCTNAGATCTSLPFSKIIAPSTTLSAATTVNNVAVLNTAVTVLTNNLYSSVYNASAVTPYSNTTGNLVLDDQGFQFGSAFLNKYLVSISFKEASGVSTPNSTASRTALSAITVETGDSNAPEPSTVFLFVSGLGALGFARLRRK